MIGVAAAVVGCRKAELPTGGAEGSADGILPDVENTIPISVTASTSTTDDNDFIITRTEFKNNEYLWSADDMIGLFAVDVANGDMKMQNKEMRYYSPNDLPTRQARFDGMWNESTDEEMPVDATYGYVAYYPYTGGVSAQYQTQTKVYTLSGCELPTVQKVEGTGWENFPVKLDFMVTNSAEAGTILNPTVRVNFGFEHLFSAVQFNLQANEVGENITELTLTAPEGVALTGKFSVEATSAGRRVIFDGESSNSVTLKLGEDGKGLDLSNGKPVWAMINPVDLNETQLTLTVTTVSGYKYNYNFTGRQYNHSNVHILRFDAPKPKVILNKALTSYSYYAAINGCPKDIVTANNLDGNAIYTENSIRITMPEGYEIVGGAVEQAGIEYTRGDSRKTAPLKDGADNLVPVALDSDFGVNVDDIPHGEWGQYVVRAYAVIKNVTSYSNPITVHVTGIPYSINWRETNDLTGWQTTGTVTYSKGYATRYYYWISAFTNYIDSGNLYSPTFYVPASKTINVTYIAEACYHTSGGNGAASAFSYSGVTTGMSLPETRKSTSLSRKYVVAGSSPDEYDKCVHDVDIVNGCRIYLSDSQPEPRNLAMNWVRYGAFSIKYRD